LTIATRGWGFNRFGVSPYGDSITSAGLSLVSAYAITTHSLRVRLSGIPLHQSAWTRGDATNPCTWTIQRQSDSTYLHPIGVTPISSTEYEIITFEALGTYRDAYRVSSDALLDVAKHSLIAPKSADFYGLLGASEATDNAKIAARRSQSVDLANRFTPTGGLDGTLTITSSGDYGNSTGVELEKKLLLRRLVSSPGDFFHLPNYGCDWKVKDLIRINELNQRKTATEKQLSQEPNLENVSVSLSLGNNMLQINVSAKYAKYGKVELTREINNA
jgi:hypothetical protein